MRFKLGRRTSGSGNVDLTLTWQLAANSPGRQRDRPRRRVRAEALRTHQRAKRRHASCIRGLDLAALDLLGQLAPLSGDVLQAFLGDRREPRLSFCLSRMLTILFGSDHARFPATAGCRIYDWRNFRSARTLFFDERRASVGWPSAGKLLGRNCAPRTGMRRQGAPRRQRHQGCTCVRSCCSVRTGRTCMPDVRERRYPGFGCGRGGP